MGIIRASIIYVFAGCRQVCETLALGAISDNGWSQQMFGTHFDEGRVTPRANSWAWGLGVRIKGLGCRAGCKV